MAHKIIRLPQVQHRTGLSKTSIYEAVKDGRFPRPVSLGARAVGWLDSAVCDWIESRAATVPAAVKPEKA